MIDLSRDSAIVTFAKGELMMQPNHVVTDEEMVYGCLSVGTEAAEVDSAYPLQLVFTDIAALDELMNALYEVRELMIKTIE